MHPPHVTVTRRIFFQTATALGISTSLTIPASGQNTPDAFDALPKAVWVRARNNGLVMIHRPAPAVLSSRATIVSPREPGVPLTVEGQVFASDGTTPAAGITVYAYNTDADGYYGANHAQYPPRLYGWMKTDNDGRFELHTILPGHYPGMQVPAHVHFTLWGKGYPPQWVDDLRFEGDRYLTPEMVARAKEEGEFSSIRPLTKSPDGVLSCRTRLRLRRETNFS